VIELLIAVWLAVGGSAEDDPAVAVAAAYAKAELAATGCEVAGWSYRPGQIVALPADCERAGEWYRHPNGLWSFAIEEA
jgi:hypothetical protein